MSRITRRQFLAGSAAATAAAFVPWSNVLGANEEIRVAVVGFRGKGSEHIGTFSKMPGVKVVALVDCDSKVLGKKADEFAKRNQKVATYTDVRKMLEDKTIDAVATATPNHWHALVSVWACQAGKDVYVEKPVSHEIWEGRKIVEAARKYKRIVQTGTQSRSDKGIRGVIEYINAGNIGKLTCVRGYCYKTRNSIGKVTEAQKIPEGIDYNLWCGPAPMDPLMRKNLHYDWHWVWSTGNGDIGNQGIHEMDMCRWMLGQPAVAPRVISLGGRLGYVDDGQTPNTQVAILDYQPAPLIFEVRGLTRKKGDKVMDHNKGIRIGVTFHCEGGYYAGGASGGWVYDNEGKKIKEFRQDGPGDHQANFIKAVRSRDIKDLNADILGGHVSSALCHMANISHRLGASINPGEAKERFSANKDAQESAERMLAHVQANEVDFKQTPLTLGAALTMDPAQERFTGDLADKANELVRRTYREPFVIRDEV